MTEKRKPWGYVAHKGEYWAGVASAEMPRKDLAKFLGDFAADGFSIKTVFDREEYLATIKSMKHWGAPRQREAR